MYCGLDPNSITDARGEKLKELFIQAFENAACCVENGNAVDGPVAIEKAMKEFAGGFALLNEVYEGAIKIISK
jgi:hypothetical protein